MEECRDMGLVFCSQRVRVLFQSSINRQAIFSDRWAAARGCRRSLIQAITHHVNQDWISSFTSHSKHIAHDSRLLSLSDMITDYEEVSNTPRSPFAQNSLAAPRRFGYTISSWSYWKHVSVSASEVTERQLSLPRKCFPPFVPALICNCIGSLALSVAVNYISCQFVSRFIRLLQLTYRGWWSVFIFIGWGKFNLNNDHLWRIKT